MKLFLVTKDESRVNEDVFREPVRVEYDDKILRRLFDDSEIYDTIIVTKSYVDSYGVGLVSKALKTLYKIQEYRVIYISYEEEHDLFLSYMSDTYIIHKKADVGRLTLDAINTIAQEEKTQIDPRQIDHVVLGKYRNLVEHYLDIKSTSAKDQYLNLHKEELIRALSSLIETAYEDETLRYKIDELSSQVLVAEEKSDNYLKQIIKLNQQLYDRTEKISRLEDQIISYKDSIDNFNEIQKEQNIYESNNKNVILYFKELEDIDFMRFHEAIYKYLNIRGMYIKSLILTDKDYISYNTYGYKRILDNVSPAFLADCDKMLRIGPAKKLLDLITSPTFKIQVIMIYDRTSTLTPVIESDYMLTFYIGKYKELYPNLELPDTSFISPYEGQWTNIKQLLIPTASKEITDLAYETYANRHPFMSTLYTLILNKQNQARGRIG